MELVCAWGCVRLEVTHVELIVLVLQNIPASIHLLTAQHYCTSCRDHHHCLFANQIVVHM